MALRAPYMHNGSEASLAEVVDLYAQGGREVRPSRSNEVRKLELTATDKADLVAFLVTLTSNDPPLAIPPLPR